MPHTGDGQHRTSLLHTVVVTSSCEIWRKEVGPGVVRRPWRAAWGRPPAMESGLGPSTGPGERPRAVCRPWRAAWGRPPAVESDLGPSAGRGERLGAVRRPWRATWGLPPNVESDLGPSAGRGERPGAVRRLWRGYQCCSCVNGNNTMNF